MIFEFIESAEKGWFTLLWHEKPEGVPTEFYESDQNKMHDNHGELIPELVEKYESEPYFRRWGYFKGVFCEREDISIWGGVNSREQYHRGGDSQGFITLNNKRLGFEYFIDDSIVKNSFFVNDICNYVMATLAADLVRDVVSPFRSGQRGYLFNTHNQFENEEEQMQILWILSQGLKYQGSVLWDGKLNENTFFRKELVDKVHSGELIVRK